MTLALGIGFAPGAKLKEKSTSFTIEPNEVAEGVAKCKRGTVAVAGGFFTPIDLGSSTRVLVRDLFREGKRKWVLRAENGFSGSPEATVYAYCDEKQYRLKAKARTVDVSGVETTAAQTLEVKCPRGSEAVTGGFDSPELTIPLASRRAGKRTWRVDVASESKLARPVTVYAYCDNSEPGLKAKSKGTAAPNGTSAAAEAKCRRGQRLRSGGFEVEASDTSGDFGLAVASRRSAGRRWEAVGYGINGTPDVTAYAYCEKKK